MDQSSGTQRRHAICMISTHGYMAVDPPLGKADTGGQVVYCLQLARHLAMLGHRVDIWTRRFEDQPASDAMPGTDGMVRVLRAPCGGPGFIPKEQLAAHIPEWVEAMQRRVQDMGIAYGFINSHYWDAGLAGASLASRWGIPHAFTPHSLGTWKQANMGEVVAADPAMAAVYRFQERIAAERAICAQADRVFGTSDDQLALLRDDCGVPADRLRVVSPGYDDRRFYPVGSASREGIRKRLGFTGPTVLALGRLARNKGYDLLIRSFAPVVERLPTAMLRLAVGGEDLGADERRVLGGLQDLIRDLRLEERVRIDHFIPEPHLADWYRAADVFVLSSRYEPIGMTAIEAMACGTPTVVTMRGGLWKQLTHGIHALFTDPLDIQDLAVTVGKALRIQPLIDTLRVQAPARARATFTWAGIAAGMISEWDGLHA